jgi:hypothetical protein
MAIDVSKFGKVLFIDDNFYPAIKDEIVIDDGIKDIVASLVSAGIEVQYWDGKGDNPPNYTKNYRIVIVDLDLEGIGFRTGDEFYSMAALALGKLQGPFIAIIMAREFEDDDAVRFQKYCKDSAIELSGIIANEGINKENASDLEKLETLISASISDKKALKLLLLWEKIADHAKEKAFGDLLKELDKTVLSLVELFSRNVGQQSTARELVDTLMRLVARRMVDLETFKELNDLVKELAEAAAVLIPSANYPTKEDRKLYNKLMYFKPEHDECYWTGDIYKTNRAYEDITSPITFIMLRFKVHQFIV